MQNASYLVKNSTLCQRNILCITLRTLSTYEFFCYFMKKTQIDAKNDYAGEKNWNPYILLSNYFIIFTAEYFIVLLIAGMKILPSCAFTWAINLNFAS